MDYKNTQTLLAAFKQAPKATSFLRDRYFPTNEATDIFVTEDVLVEYKDGNKKLAPFVSPRKNGMVVLRDGYEARRYAPANIAPKRPLTVDDLKRKGFGEALFSGLTPAQRQAALIVSDLTEMDEMITRREEKMAAEVMLTNGCVMHHYADKGDEYEDKVITFYEGGSNPAVYTPSATWSKTADILGDIYKMAKMLTSKGLPATDVILGSDVAEVFMNNEGIQKLLDIRNYNIGSVDPFEMYAGAAQLAKLNINGKVLTFITYDETYEEIEGSNKGKDVAFIDADKIVVTAPAAGRTAYGAITQLEQSDGEMHTYEGRRVPHYVADASNNSREITLTAAPLMMPNQKNSFISATVL